MWRLLLAALLAIVSTLALAGPAVATPGQLDPSFGSGGIAPISFQPRALALQPDGKPVVTGRLITQPAPFHTDLAVARYLPDGSPDPRFGTGGTDTPTFPGHNDSLGTGVAVRPDGRPVVAGPSSQPTPGGFPEFDYVLAGYRRNGKLDDDFGTRGTTSFRFDHTFPEGGALAVQADGKLVLAGGSSTPATGTGIDFALARFNPDGTLDPSFGSGGVVTTDFSTGDRGDRVRVLVIQPDGKLLAAGVSGFFARHGTTIAIARYNPDGSLDPTFGSGGKLSAVYRSGAFQNNVSALVVQPDGKLVVAGNTSAGTSLDFTDYALARFNPDGSLDPTFGSGGTFIMSIGSRLATEGIGGLVLQADGKLVASGSATFDVLPFRSALLRFNPDGSLDPTFGSGGIVLNEVVGAGPLVAQPDGKLLSTTNATVAGDPTRSVFALVRYLMS